MAYLILGINRGLPQLSGFFSAAVIGKSEPIHDVFLVFVVSIFLTLNFCSFGLSIVFCDINVCQLVGPLSG